MLALGFWLPGDFTALRPLIPLLLGGILYFSCLTLTIGEIGVGLADPATWRRLAWLSLAKLVALPVAVWLLVLPIAPAWAPGMMLVGMMPAAFSSMAFANLYGGSRLLALLMIVVTSALTPIVAPLLLALVGAGGVAPGAIAIQAAYIAVLLVAPFAAAQLTRRLAPAIIATHGKRLGSGSIACICVLVFVAVAVNRPAWAHFASTDLLAPLALTTLAVVVFALGGWAVGLALPRAEAVSFACIAVYMNNGLGVAIATRFFGDDPHMLLPALLIQVPMMAAVPLVTALVGRQAGAAAPPPA
jgi:BASS family bile acid:Na+ symporter